MWNDRNRENEAKLSTGVGALGSYRTESVGAEIAPQSVVDQVQHGQAQAIAMLENELSELASKLQPFLYDGPSPAQTSAGTEKDRVGPPSMSSHLNAIASNTVSIHRLSSMVRSLRDAVVR